MVDDAAPVKGGAGAGQARTRLARRAVVAAARQLFLEHGYAATTMATISETADVPAATVYRLFASKLGILRALLDVSIGGDDQPVAVLDRPAITELLARADPVELLAGLAAGATAINERTADVYRVLTSAADSDPAAAGLLADINRQRDHGQGQFVAALDRADALRPGLSRRAAGDLVHAVAAPEVFRLLVVDRGWTPSRYRTWLAATLDQQLR